MEIKKPKDGELITHKWVESDGKEHSITTAYCPLWDDDLDEVDRENWIQKQIHKDK